MFPSRRDLGTALVLALALVALGAVWVSLHLGFRHKAHVVPEWDHHRYLAMARPLDERLGAPESREAPFLWRILVPLLVERMTRLGLHIHSAFYLMTTVSLIGFVAALFLYLRMRGLSPNEALLGVTLTALLPGAVRWYQYQYWMTDPLCLFFMMLALMAIEYRYDAGTVGVSILGILTRETFVLVMAYAVLRRYEEQGVRAALKLAIVLLPGPLLVLLALHTFLIPDPPPPALTATIIDVLAFRREFLLKNQLYFATLGSFGILFVFAFLSIRSLARAISRRPSTTVFVVGAGASLLLGSNTDRLLVYAVPVILPFTLAQVREVAAHSRFSWSVFAWAALAVQLVLFVTTPFAGLPGISVYQPNNWFVITAALAFLGLARLFPARDSSFPNLPPAPDHPAWADASAHRKG